ncbi:hypothetical protein CHLNCDRAFT_140441 [Chlorella variabilis]|uniref:Kazal-like domain-containing protein n=1 Tax=Chlorella variabilis TaxID=554065 RepID=E1Z720_CHLVA|nr:hypothetical protein CHLNCDRAFT_140441 [Chlorella variabilis]EFN58453.1 hypothetical protein CHLNCDRAFT_140441 [Chlorella variabilis]|eukprot:XP_005850555.1 hypothetical protein CHLNCDRAFT_140441 [Chlorella variabilis]
MACRLPYLLLLASLFLAGCLAGKSGAGYAGGVQPAEAAAQPAQPTHLPDTDISRCKHMPKRSLPVCGQNGQSYGSLYEACLGGTTPRCRSQCPCPGTPPASCPGCKNVVCPAIYDPVCCNGRTFPNSCLAACCGYDAAECTPGACPSPPTNPPSCPGCKDILCPAIYDPVCCNGITFSNSCLASCCGYDSACTPGACPSP